MTETRIRSWFDDPYGQDAEDAVVTYHDEMYHRRRDELIDCQLCENGNAERDPAPAGA